MIGHVLMDIAFLVESQRSGFTSVKNGMSLRMTDRNASPVPSLALTDHDFGAVPTNRHSTLQR